MYNYGQLVGRRPEIGCDIGHKISSFIFLCNYDQLIGRTPLIGRTLVGKKQLKRFGGSTTNKLVVQDDWSYVGQRTIVGCKFDAKMANQLYGQLFPCGDICPWGSQGKNC